jgi:hypothetical protein
MLVLPDSTVECPAKIAMTTLRSSEATMDLLPNHRLPRLIFLEAFLALGLCKPFNREIGNGCNLHHAANRARSKGVHIADPKMIDLSAKRPTEYSSPKWIKVGRKAEPREPWG